MLYTVYNQLVISVGFGHLNGNWECYECYIRVMRS